MSELKPFIHSYSGVKADYDKHFSPREILCVVAIDVQAVE